ncbi:hypothetical protein MMC30_006452 [Trapelia coarctata]|nr:hypothetical protein [Trapelia coarctata]
MEARPAILASCYTVNSSTALLKGFHYSTTGAGGIPSPPRSPPLAATYIENEKSASYNTNESATGRTGGAADIITEECERLFCDKLRDIFLVERKVPVQASRVVTPYKSTSINKHQVSMNMSEWLEVWDYTTGLNFRGFVGGQGKGKSLFVFFGEEVVGQDLKPGLMALIELTEILSCLQLVVCLDRSSDPTGMKTLMRDLGWVGFELATLAPWNGGVEETSRQWVMLAMET